MTKVADSNLTKSGEAVVKKTTRPRRSGEETRRDILAMTDRLFRERGFSAVAIADVAAALGMSPANVFKHFHSKIALVDAIMLQRIKVFEEKMHLLDETHTPHDRMLMLVRTLMQNHRNDLTDNPYMIEVFLQTPKRELSCGAHYHQVLTQQFATIIGDGIQQGIYRRADPVKEATLALTVLSCVLHPLLISREDVGILATRCEDVVMMIDRSLKYALEK